MTLAFVEGPPALRISTLESSFNAGVSHHRESSLPGPPSIVNRVFEKALPEDVVSSGILFDFRTGETRFRVANPTSSWFLCVAWRHDGQHFALGSDDGSVRIFNAVTGCEVLLLEHEERVSSVAWRPDGKKLATGSGDKEVRIFDTMTGEKEVHLRHRDSVRSLAWHPDCRRLATGSNDKLVRIFDIDNSGAEVSGYRACLRPAESQELMLAHPDCVWSVAWKPGGCQLATACADRSVRIWCVTRGKKLLEIRHSHPVRSIAWKPDGCKLATACNDGKARVIDSESGRVDAQMTHPDHVTCVVWNPNNDWELATGCLDRCVRIFDETGAEIYRTRHTSQIPSISWSAGNRIEELTTMLRSKTWMPEAELTALVDEAKNIGYGVCTGIDPDFISDAEISLKAVQQRARELHAKLTSDVFMSEDELNELATEAREIRAFDDEFIIAEETRLRGIQVRGFDLLAMLQSDRWMSADALDQLLDEARSISMDVNTISEAEERHRAIQCRALELRVILSSDRFLDEDELSSVLAEAAGIGAFDPGFLAEAEPRLREIRKRGLGLLAVLESSRWLREEELQNLLAQAKAIEINPILIAQGEQRLRAIQLRAIEILATFGSNMFFREHELISLLAEARTIEVDSNLISEAEARLRAIQRRGFELLSILQSSKLMSEEELSALLAEAVGIRLDPDVIAQGEVRLRAVQQRAQDLLASLWSQKLMSELELTQLVDEAMHIGIDEAIISEAEARLRAIQQLAQGLLVRLQSDVVMQEDELSQLVADSTNIGIDPALIASEEARLRALMQAEAARLQALRRAEEAAAAAAEAARLEEARLAALADAALRKRHQDAAHRIEAEIKAAASEFSDLNELLGERVADHTSAGNNIDADVYARLMRGLPDSLILALEEAQACDVAGYANFAAQVEVLRESWAALANLHQILNEWQPYSAGHDAEQPLEDHELEQLKKQQKHLSIGMDIFRNLDGLGLLCLEPVARKSIAHLESFALYWARIIDDADREKEFLDTAQRLLHAVCSGDYEAVQQILRSSEDACALMNKAGVVNGSSVLHAAAAHGRDAVVPLLHSYGAEVNNENHEGYTPLDVAIQCLQSAELDAQFSFSESNEDAQASAKATVEDFQNTISLLISLGAPSKGFVFQNKQEKWVRRPAIISNLLNWRAMLVERCGSVKKAFKTIDANSSGGIVLYEMRAFLEDAVVEAAIRKHCLTESHDEIFRLLDELGPKGKENCIAKDTFMLLEELDDTCSSDKWQDLLLGPSSRFQDVFTPSTQGLSSASPSRPPSRSTNASPAVLSSGRAARSAISMIANTRTHASPRGS
eukprot:TRINITY_DN25712_c0_g1_i1.p1 TRINITY_DN25712_c0_g1~~TRINITY_DN25712_c0_g1_i1.p1  ORF type:complete len:1326 (-),score=215.65 TRINITY_DN25712_c0_g1_i1:167-4144(-)